MLAHPYKFNINSFRFVLKFISRAERIFFLFFVAKYYRIKFFKFQSFPLTYLRNNALIRLSLKIFILRFWDSTKQNV